MLRLMYPQAQHTRNLEETFLNAKNQQEVSITPIEALTFSIYTTYIKRSQ